MASEKGKIPLTDCKLHHTQLLNPSIGDKKKHQHVYKRQIFMQCCGLLHVTRKKIKQNIQKYYIFSPINAFQQRSSNKPVIIGFLSEFNMSISPSAWSLSQSLTLNIINRITSRHLRFDKNLLVQKDSKQS